jgi:hypothetical protein
MRTDMKFFQRVIIFALVGWMIVLADPGASTLARGAYEQADEPPFEPSIGYRRGQSPRWMGHHPDTSCEDGFSFIMRTTDPPGAPPASPWEDEVTSALHAAVAAQERLFDEEGCFAWFTQTLEARGLTYPYRVSLQAYPSMPGEFCVEGRHWNGRDPETLSGYVWSYSSEVGRIQRKSCEFPHEIFRNADR